MQNNFDNVAMFSRPAAVRDDFNAREKIIVITISTIIVIIIIINIIIIILIISER